MKKRVRFMIYECETGYLLEVYNGNETFKVGQQWAFSNLRNLKSGLTNLLEPKGQNDE
jgi:hypothetical protein